MSNFSAVIPAADLDAANLRLEELGFGPNNFSVPCGGVLGSATHAGLHCWPNSTFYSALVAMQADFPALKIRPGTGAPNFDELMSAESLTWIQPDGAHDVYMKGDQVGFGGKTWESLIDNNVWEPGTSGWREVVSQGYPEWVQPTGAHDAYQTGDRVSFEGANYESTMDANVWSPSVLPSAWSEIQ